MIYRSKTRSEREAAHDARELARESGKPTNAPAGASGVFYIDIRWKGYSRIQVTTGTKKTQRARAMHGMLLALRDRGRRDVLEGVARGKLGLPALYDAFATNQGNVDDLLIVRRTEPLRPLVKLWLRWLASPASISPRTRRSYSGNTVRRYEQSWDVILRHLPDDDATVADLNGEFLEKFRAARAEEHVQGATINRDFNTLQSFIGWLRSEKRIAVPPIEVKKYRESPGKDRWLTAEEVAQLLRVTDRKWLPLVHLVLRTGLRIGEAQGLVWSDVQLGSRVIRLRNNSIRMLKTDSSHRDLPISAALLPHLVSHARRVPSGPMDAVFPDELGDYRTAYRAFKRSVKHAKLASTTIHDLRHTYGVHCALAGIPLPRIQARLGHTTPAMTLRYAKHAEKAYNDADSQLVDTSMGDLYSPTPNPEANPDIRIIA